MTPNNFQSLSVFLTAWVFEISLAWKGYRDREKMFDSPRSLSLTHWEVGVRKLTGIELLKP